MNKNKSNIAEIVLKGKPLNNINLIDCHAHLGQWFNFNIPEFNENAIKKSMDIIGIEKMCISAMASCGPDFIYGNRLVFEVINKYPLKLFGYVVLNPNYPDIMFTEIKKYWGKESVIGIKIHPETHDYPPDGNEYRKIYDFLEEKEGLLLSHVWGINAVKIFGKLAKRYKKITFIFGHSGGEPKAIYEAISVANRTDNVYLDLTGSYHYQGIVELMVKEVGPERVLFGTDTPFLDARPAVGRIAFSEISDFDKMKVFGLNMIKIMEKAQGLIK